MTGKDPVRVTAREDMLVQYLEGYRGTNCVDVCLAQSMQCVGYSQVQRSLVF